MGIPEALDAIGSLFAQFGDDEGVPFALELMRHYVVGGGETFRRGQDGQDSDWREFMGTRPEIHQALARRLRDEVPRLARPAASPRGTFGPLEIHNVRLYTLLSMRLTLHGAHRLQVRGRYTRGEVTDRIVDQTNAVVRRMTMNRPRRHLRGTPRSRQFVITLHDVTMLWEDAGDLHNALTTSLEDNRRVSDSDFRQLAELIRQFEPVRDQVRPYDIGIQFGIRGESAWLSNGTDSEHLRGWPYAWRRGNIVVGGGPDVP